MFLTMTNRLMCTGDAPSHQCLSKKDKCPSQTIPSGMSVYNGVVKNWFMPNSYVLAHSKNDGLHTVGSPPIFSYCAGGPRTLRFSQRSDIQVINTRHQRGCARNGAQRPIEICVNDGDLIIQGGHMQTTHKHDIRRLKENETTTPHIHWIVRAFDPAKLK
jgi:hypothetical protein